MITGGGQQGSKHPRRQQYPQFHLPTGGGPALEQLQAAKQAHLAQDEIKQSATNLLKNTTSLAATDLHHAKRFKKEIDSSKAIPYLLQNHLGWVSGLPEIGQLAALIGEKWLRTKLEVE